MKNVYLLMYGLIVMNDEINAARDVTKTNTYRVETFRSPDLGYLGYVDEDKVSFYRVSTKRHTVNSEFDVRNISEFPKADILYSYVEPNVAMIQALQTSGVKGIVFAGTGAGGLSDLERDAMKTILSSPSGAKPVVVRSNRTGTGRVIPRKEYDELYCCRRRENAGAERARYSGCTRRSADQHSNYIHHWPWGYSNGGEGSQGRSGRISRKAGS